MSSSKFVYVTYIRITPEKLWHALTTPEIIKQYRFGMSVESEWKVGSTWRMYADGSLMDSGEILESVSQKRLVMSWLNEWKPEFRAEGNSRCVYEIEPTGASAKLTLTHSIEQPDSKFIGPCRRAGRWSYRISSRCLKRGMLLSSIIVGTEINHGKGGFGNHSSLPVPLRSSMRASGPNQSPEPTAGRRDAQV
jgi:uncharacterized protein YndB with AHSA1/START domain